MVFSDYLTPVQPQALVPGYGFDAVQLGSTIHFYSAQNENFNIGDYHIALIGVPEERGAVNNAGCAQGPDAIRRQLLQLTEGAWQPRIADLGNIKQGHTLADTYHALAMVAEECLRAGAVPLILGGSHDITFAQYLAYSSLEQRVDLVVIDRAFDLNEDNSTTLATRADCYLNRILLHQPNHLFNFSNIGYQTYFVPQDSLAIMDKLLFDVHRLGQFYNNMHMVEPIVRNATMLSLDCGAIRSSDAGANNNACPNGFFGQDACQMARYAGMSDKLSSFGIYEYNPALDTHNQTAMLLSQVIWYFIDGYYQRKNEVPFAGSTHYITYRTGNFDSGHELIFLKSKKSDRWWLQVPYPITPQGNERYHMVPCNYSDYETASAGDMPDLWWRTYRKFEN